MKYVDNVAMTILVFILIVLFAGEPDIHGVLIENISKCEQSQELPTENSQ